MRGNMKNKRWIRKVLLVFICIGMVTGILAVAANSWGSQEVGKYMDTVNNKGATQIDIAPTISAVSPSVPGSSLTPVPANTPGSSSTPAPKNTPVNSPTLVPTNTPIPTTTVTLAAVGDDLIHTQIINSAKRVKGKKTYDHLFKHIKKDIEAVDLGIINQETVLGGSKLGYSGYPRFNSPTEIGDAIVEAGFDVVLHATNHAMDKGEAGLQRTLEFWKKYSDITVLGVNETQEDANTVKVVEVNGIRIAMLNYTYGLNGLPLPKNRTYMVNLLEEQSIREDVAKAKQQSDFVIVFPHWGNEYVYQPVDSQKKWTKLFLELGVDLVIGAHPHVLETVEWVEGENGHKMLVYYSLGNYISSQTEVPRMLGGLAKVTIEKVGNQKAVIKEASITPIVTHISKKNKEYTVYKLSEYTQKLASKHKLSSKGLSIKKLKSLSKEILGDWYTQ